MPTYKTDRAFTDLAHKEAINHYNIINWIENNPDNIEELDMNHGIDYVFGENKKVQERFRKEKYANFNEITIRYARPNNYHQKIIQSEYFKIKADYNIWIYR